MTRSLRLPKRFEKLAADFEERERFWAKKVGRKALFHLPRKTHRHGEVGNAYYSLARLAFRAGKWERALHFYGLQESLDRRHAGDADLEEYEVESYQDRLDEAGWITGDWPRFERHVRRGIRGFGPGALVEGHIDTYVDWAILGYRAGAEKVLPDLEPAAARERLQMEEFATAPALAVLQALVIDDALARAYFWLGEFDQSSNAADRYLAGLDAWKELPTRPRHVQLGPLAPSRKLVSGLKLLASGDDAEIRSPAASRLLLDYLLARRKDPAGYLFEFTLLHLIAVSWADPENELAVSFLEAYPLHHLLERDRSRRADVPFKDPGTR